MRGLMAVAAGLALIAAGQDARAQDRPPPDPPSILQPTAMDIGSATVTPDIVFSRQPGYRPLRLDLYQPKVRGKRRPALIWLHGGGWAMGDQRGSAFAGTDMPKMLGDIAAHGFTVASVDYRLSGEAKFPAQIQDARAAIRWLRANADAYNIDPTKIFVWGGSAGGFLASMVGVTCGDSGYEASAAPGPGPGGPPPPGPGPGPGGPPPPGPGPGPGGPPPGGPGGPAPAPPAPGSECVQGVVAFYPVVDLMNMPDTSNPNGASGRLLGCAPSSCPADKQALADIVAHIDSKDPPFLIMHGDSDHVVPIAQSRLLETSLKAKGVPTEMVVVPGGDHVFPNLDPALRARLMTKIYSFLDALAGRAGPATH